MAVPAMEPVILHHVVLQPTGQGRMKQEPLSVAVPRVIKINKNARMGRFIFLSTSWPLPQILG